MNEIEIDGVADGALDEGPATGEEKDLCSESAPYRNKWKRWKLPLDIEERTIEFAGPHRSSCVIPYERRR